MILQHDGNGDRGCDLLVHFGNPVGVGHRLFRGRHHHGTGAQVLGHAGQVRCPARAAVAGADDDGNAAFDRCRGAADELPALIVIQAIGLAQHSKDGDAVDAEDRRRVTADRHEGPVAKRYLPAVAGQDRQAEQGNEKRGSDHHCPILSRDLRFTAGILRRCCRGEGL